ncbi:MAG: class I SAM-dependent methyltransferase [SAR324 cluster bacterium]|nr:class I SAM-dependent methyltransferase [SAR324 cluster bacterium]
MEATDTILRHYQSPDLLSRIEEGLGKMGKSPSTVVADDLGPVDEFHTRGAAATAELIALLNAGPATHLLDVGSGLGGPARRLAAATGCRVTGIDLSADYCAVGTELTKWLGLTEQVKLTQGDGAQAVDTAAGPYDAAWTIHVGMNVRDKPAFYAGIAKALKPGASFVIYDVLSNGGGDFHFPLPWAKTPESSFVATLDEMKGHLAGAGFELLQVSNQTAESLAFFDEIAARSQKLGAPPPLGLHLVLGPDLSKMIPNLRKNLAEGRAQVGAILCRKAAL